MDTERLTEQDRLKSELVATVSHEMRRPLTAIIGFSQTLRARWRELPDELREEIVGRVEQNAQSMEHMIAQLLDFSRLELGQFHIDLRPVDLDYLIDTVVKNLAFDLADHEVRVEGAAGIRLVTEPYAFERILGNLLTNAARYSPVESGIDILVDANGSRVEITVADHGRGISEEDRERIFQRFYRGRHSGPGAGLGLAVVRELVELHRGSIRVGTGLDGTGAAFTVSFPAEKPVP